MVGGSDDPGQHRLSRIQRCPAASSRWCGWWPDHHGRGVHGGSSPRRRTDCLATRGRRSGRGWVGAIAGSATTEYLLANRIHYQGYANAEEGLTALQSGTIDAFVLQAAARLDGAAAVLLDGRGARDGLRPCNTAAAFQPGSTLRKPFDIALLEEIKSAWKQTLFGIWE